jgi:hypothetical protein
MHEPHKKYVKTKLQIPYLDPSTQDVIKYIGRIEFELLALQNLDLSKHLILIDILDHKPSPKLKHNRSKSNLDGSWIKWVGSHDHTLMCSRRLP